MKMTTEIRISQVDGKDADDDVSLTFENDDGDEIVVVFWDGEDKKFVLTVEKDELLEAVARVAGGDIRLTDNPKGDY